MSTVLPPFKENGINWQFKR